MSHTIFRIKEWIKWNFGPSDALIHVNIGMAVFIILALLLRNRRHGGVIALAILAGLQIANEAVDAMIEMNRSGRIRWGEGWRDTVATLFWPTVVFLVWRPGRKSAPKGD